MFARVPNESSFLAEQRSAFKYYKNVSPDIAKTSVVEVPFNQDFFSMPVFAVYNLDTTSFEPYFLATKVEETESRVEAVGATGTPSFVNDANFSTYLEFPLKTSSNKAEITFKFEKAITASSLSLVLDAYVALPQSISISANVGGKDYVVLAPVRPSQGNIVFPKTTSAIWRVVFDYVQPLRISEMKFNDISGTQITGKGLRFLAQPGERYQIYFDADRYVATANKETGDLYSDTGVVRLKATNSIPNPEYVPVDSDADGVPNLTDNCIGVANADQKDADGNGLGDACEDYDRDGIVNVSDNCSDVPNRAQEDTDKDDVGDVCDNFDNRVTERMPWLPWAGIGIAGAVILGLFVIVLRHKTGEGSEENFN